MLPGEWIARILAHGTCAFIRCIKAVILNLMVKSFWIPTVNILRQMQHCLTEVFLYFRNKCQSLKEAIWPDWKRLVKRIKQLLDIWITAIRRCWQVWVNNPRYQGQNDSGRPKAIVERQDRAIVSAGVTELDSSLSTIHYVACTYVSNMTLVTWLRESNFCSHRQLRRLPLSPVHRRDRLECCRAW